MGERFSLVPSGGEEISFRSPFSSPLVVGSKLSVPLYLVSGFRRRALRKTAEDSGFDLASLARAARVQLRSKKDVSPVTNRDIYFSISQNFKEMLFAGESFPCFGRMITVISCCRLSSRTGFVQSTHGIVAAELVTDIQHHRLLKSIKFRQVSCITTDSAHLAFTNERYEASTLACKKLSRKKISFGMVHFTFSKCYKTTLDEELSTRLLALRTRLLFEERQNFDSSPMTLYNPKSPLLKKIETAASAAGHPHCEFVMKRVPFSGSEKVVIIEKISLRSHTDIHLLQKRLQKTAQVRLRPSRFHFSTASSANFVENTFAPSLSAPLTSCLLSSSPLSGKSFSLVLRLRSSPGPSRREGNIQLRV